MGVEVDLLAKYPKVVRDLTARLEAKSEESRTIARKFGFDYFDGDRNHGYGGFTYQERFWKPVIPDLVVHFHLDEKSRVLDVGCAKGFFLHDLQLALPGIEIAGIDISSYAIENAIETVKSKVAVGDARKLQFEDNSFDLVMSINTIHNLDREYCAMALQEIQRVSGGKSFVTVDAYRNEIEKERMEAWNLTALTMMSVDEWKRFFAEVGYDGDYYWFIP
jgi:ubiquinone/menaquinone biosynthesis C-methylase UbiE